MFLFQYRNFQGITQSHELNTGEVIFVLGANGVGKSTLMQRLYAENVRQAKRISAHRKTWFDSNAVSLTASGKLSIEEHIANFDASANSRWREEYSEHRAGIAIYELIEAENTRARDIARSVDSGNLDEAKTKSQQKAPLDIINDLLKISNLPIEISVGNNDAIFAQKEGGPQYSIAELSDGERNALLIAAAVLTAKSDTLLIIDEPERHLHRSIISPLLSSLFQKRSDCAFVISTHDVSLPQDNPEANVLLIRSCRWLMGRFEGWDTDFLMANSQIPSEIKQAILGGRRKILFIEGRESSLDKQIYQILFPRVSVNACGGCTDVKNNVQGISSTESLNWVQAFGLIDADDRTPEEISQLEGQNIFPLPCYSVESLYYHPEMIRRVAQIVPTEEKPEDMVNNAFEAALAIVALHKDRLCARRCERVARSRFLEELPNLQIIQSENLYRVEVDIESIRNTEIRKFDEFFANQDVESLICRYPVRETQALTEIAKKLGFQSRAKYESAVRRLLTSDAEAANALLEKLGKLAAALQDVSTEERAVPTGVRAEAARPTS